MGHDMNQAETPAPAYQVLARKYRPETFADLIGQEAMVRTLRNAFAADRIAHAWLMTGIRGTGKTTTARIIAKGLNCIGADGQGGPTTEPCGQCEHCRAIAEGRHVDVLETDAASRTGVGDIREIIDSVAYRAASARFKVYVIDEVHMLSNSAFNALLKTLEEPPAHVKFIFATTEIRKVPVTVLSRCQRFDLRRIEPEVMIAHLSRVSGAEGADISDAALALIARAAEGSVRDGMSLLDQALSQGAGRVEREAVRAMLGLADRGRVLDLFDLIMRGDAAGALRELSGQYADGADPMAVLRDLAEITHWVSVIKITPDAADDPTVGPDERMRGADMAGRLPMRALTRMWQMLLKALEEVALAPNAMMAAEMAVIRLTHVADLPDPGELVRKLRAGGDGGGGARPPAAAGPAAQGPGAHAGGVPAGPVGYARGGPSNGGSAQALHTHAAPDPLAAYARFDAVVDLIREKRDMQLLLDVERFVRLVRYRPGRIEYAAADGAPPGLAAQLARRLQDWTGARWGISVVAEGGAPTLAEARAATEEAARGTARDHPLVRAVLEAFPQARICTVRALDPPNSADEVLPEAETAPEPEFGADADDTWDPFDDS